MAVGKNNFNLYILSYLKSSNVTWVTDKLSSHIAIFASEKGKQGEIYDQTTSVCRLHSSDFSLLNILSLRDKVFPEFLLLSILHHSSIKCFPDSEFNIHQANEIINILISLFNR